MERLKDARGNVSYRQFDDLGRVIRETSPDPDGGNNLRSLTNVYLYHPDGRLLAKWQESGASYDAVGRIDYEYDAVGRLWKVSDELGDTQILTYDKLDQVVQETDVHGTIKRRTYDDLGRLISEATLEGTSQQGITGVLTVRYEYDARGLLVHSVDANGDNSYVRYDAMGRKVFEFEPDTSWAGDDGHANEQGKKGVAYEYAAGGVLARIIRPGNEITVFNSYDLAGRLKAELKVGTGNFAYEFDAAGNRTKVTDPDGNVTHYEYDKLNRLQYERITLNGVMLTKSYDYDANGNLAEFTDRDGRRTVYQYDALNRRTLQTSYDPAGSPSDQTAFGYDQHGNRSSAESRGFANGAFRPIVTYLYSEFDVRGRAQQVTQTHYAVATPLTVKFRYQFHDQLSGSGQSSAARYGYVVTASVGNTVYYNNVYQFDAAGREVSASQDADGVVNDKIVERRYYWGYGPAAGDSGTTPYAERQDRLLRKQNIVGTGFVDLGTTDTYYEREDSHLVRRINHSKAYVSHQYNYDVTDALRRYVDRTNTVSNPVHEFDPSPAPPSAFAPFNRITAIGATDEIDYDLEGHVTKFRDTDWFNKNFTLEWISGDRLVKTTVDGKNTFYSYDAFGRLIAKKTADDVMVYVYDGGQQTLRFRSTNFNTLNFAAREFYSAGTGELLAADVASSGVTTTYWALNDKNGTVRDVVYYSGGSYNTAQIDYTAGGRAVGAPVEAIARYEGQIYHAELAGTYKNGQWRSSLLGGRALSTMSGAESHRYGGKDPGRAEDVAWYDQADRFYAGLWNSVTFGASSFLRGQFFGEFATRNHQGGAYLAGTFTGIGVSMLVQPLAGLNAARAAGALQSGLGSAANVARALQLQRAANGYAMLGAGVGVVQSSQAVYDTAWNGEPYNWLSLAGFAPLVGWGAGRLAGGLRNAGAVAPSSIVLNSARRDAWRSSFGQPSEGLGQLVRDLPRGHEARLDLARMIREVRASGGAVSNKGLTGGTYAQFIPAGDTAVFRYQPSKLRVVDLLEEQVHWQQITTGQHLRTYAGQSTTDVLEILAKQRVLQHSELTPVLRMEWLDDLARVRAGTYGK
jgi:YD repeat-containing protein